ncbi:PaaI family thioesterase [Nocardioides insulae]|uniref:PaaI family thioesterase n=1 Tax=Nocardioides insulae TaxID=394734 RepID=UPI000424CE12|nr:PaaI family thioesterase [Nocardioides insulae]
MSGVDGIEAMMGRRGKEAMSADLHSEMVGMAAELRGFLDALAMASLDPDTAAELRADLASWRRRMEVRRVPEAERHYGRVRRTPGRGQALVPVFTRTERGERHLAGTVRFGAFHLGVNGAVHGGALSVLFDDLLGTVAHWAGPVPSRTAYLKTDYRAIAPIDVTLGVRCWIERVEGRKRFVRGEITHGDVVCAEAEALFLELRPGQQ